MIDTRTVTLTRTAASRYTATNSAGASVEFGQGEGLVSPVELLLAAIAGCAAIDVDVVTTRRSEPSEFTVTASGTKEIDDGRSRLNAIDVSFYLRFPDDDAGREATSLIERLVRLSHDAHCTVSRTVELGAPVTMRVD